MQVVFVILLSIILGYVILKKRKFDWYTIAVFSAFIYYYPCLLGNINFKNGHENISWEVYMCVALYLLVLFLFMLFNDHYVIVTFNNRSSISSYNSKVNSGNSRPIYQETATNYAVVCIELIALLLLVYTFVKYGGFKLSFNKAQMLAITDRFTEYLKYIALFSFVYGGVNNGKGIFIVRLLSALLIGYTFLLGHRSFVVIGIIAIFMNYVSTEIRMRFIMVVKKYKWVFLFMFLAAFFFLFVKNVFAAFMAGNYELVKSRLTNSEYYIESLLNSESNVIVSNLQRVCVSDMHYSVFDYLLSIIRLIPFMGGNLSSLFGYESFSKKLNMEFNSRYDEGIGLGSTYLGEAYAIGGGIAIIIILVITFCFFTWMMKKRNRCKTGVGYTFISIMLSYFAFYIHRNSLDFLLITGRSYMYIWILILIFRCVLKGTLIKE